MPLQESMHPTTENTTFPQPCLQSYKMATTPLPSLVSFATEINSFRCRNQCIQPQKSHPTTEITTFPQPSLQKGNTPNSTPPILNLMSFATEINLFRCRNDHLFDPLPRERVITLDGFRSAKLLEYLQISHPISQCQPPSTPLPE